MKTLLYATVAILIGTSAAQAASAASERAGGQVAPTAQGEREPYIDQREISRVTLMGQRPVDAAPPSPANTGAVFRTWTGNDNEG